MVVCINPDFENFPKMEKLIQTFEDGLMLLNSVQHEIDSYKEYQPHIYSSGEETWSETETEEEQELQFEAIFLDDRYRQPIRVTPSEARIEPKIPELEDVRRPPESVLTRSYWDWDKDREVIEILD